MGYILCFIIGGLAGVFTMALVSVNANKGSVKPKDERELYMGTCSLSNIHNAQKEEKPQCE